MIKKQETFLIVPGFGELTTDPPYRKIAKLAKSQGYKVVPIDIKWSRRTVSHWIHQFTHTAQHQHQGHITALGFSLGAYIVFCANQNLKFDKLLLCSLSPYFKEDLPQIPESAKKFFGKRRMRDFAQHPTPSIETNTTFFFGDQDWTLAINKVKNLVDQEPRIAKLKLINNVAHDISNDAYLKKVEHEIKHPH